MKGKKCVQLLFLRTKTSSKGRKYNEVSWKHRYEFWPSRSDGAPRVKQRRRTVNIQTFCLESGIGPGCGERRAFKPSPWTALRTTSCSVKGGHERRRGRQLPLSSSMHPCNRVMLFCGDNAGLHGVLIQLTFTGLQSTGLILSLWVTLLIKKIKQINL